MSFVRSFVRYGFAVLSLLVLLGFFAVVLKAQNSANGPSGRDRQNANNAASDSPSVNTQVKLQPGYTIGSGDILSINVWRETEISQKLVVRPDGMITLPLIGDVPAAGQTPEQLAAAITKKLEAILTSPQVSVIVAEVHSKYYSVIGEVAKPGEYPLTRPTTVLDAISEAGGFKDFAKIGKIYVLHLQNGKRIRVPVRYNQIVKGKGSDTDYELSSGDAIVVP
jgi:polysaccharide biosynthesis/export protein